MKEHLGWLVRVFKSIDEVLYRISAFLGVVFATQSNWRGAAVAAFIFAFAVTEIWMSKDQNNIVNSIEVQGNSTQNVAKAIRRLREKGGK